MKNVKTIVACALVTVTVFGMIIINSCTKTKSNPCANITCYNNGTCDNGTCICPSGYTGTYCQTATNSTITLNNQTFTPIYVTVNGSTSTIAVGGALTYTGIPGASFTYTAYTYGTNSIGGQVGEEITWGDTYTFPSSGDSPWNLFTTSAVFFLKVQNNDPSYVGNGLYVNYGLTEQSFDNISIQNTGIVYNTGYYDAFTNTEILIYKGATTSYWYLYPTFNFVNNQYELMTLP